MACSSSRDHLASFTALVPSPGIQRRPVRWCWSAGSEKTYGQIRLRPEVDFLCHILLKPFLSSCADALMCTWRAERLVHQCYSWVKITAGFWNLWKSRVGLGLNCWVCFLNKTVVRACMWVMYALDLAALNLWLWSRGLWFSERDANIGVIVDSRLCKNNIKGESQDISKSDESGYLPKLNPRSWTSCCSQWDIWEITSEQENCSPPDPVSHQLKPFSAWARNTQKVS